MRVFTDGACSGNPGPGGWAWVGEDGRHDSGGESATTNQRMELTAVLRAVEAHPDGPLEINSDSTYVVNCFRDRWHEAWIAKNWVNSQRKPVANRDLWEPLVGLVTGRGGEVTFKWVKGHAGHDLNEEADRLAVEALNRHRDGMAARAAAGGAAAASAWPTGPEPPWPTERAIVVTGARALDADQEAGLVDAVEGLDPGYDVVVSGLRLGAELTAAEAAARAGVPVAVVLPYADPAASWPAGERARFDARVHQAHWVVTLDGDPARPSSAVEARNRWLWESAVGAIVVGDEKLAAEAEEAGLGVITI